MSLVLGINNSIPRRGQAPPPPSPRNPNSLFGKRVIGSLYRANQINAENFFQFVQNFYNSLAALNLLLEWIGRNNQVLL